MHLGAAQLDITPPVGVELSGFALRLQPSTGVLDPLFARALYIVDEGRRLLWIHCDLIGFDIEIVSAFRAWALRELDLAAHEVMLSATHTHSGPCTIRLQEAGAYDRQYMVWLHSRLQETAREAMNNPAPCAVVAVEGWLDLAVHRRHPASAHTDPRVGALGFTRADGSFAAVVVNHAIHPVALGHVNRQISADLFGPAADELSRGLPGNPVALVTNGACGNLNPPSINEPAETVSEWGRRIARAVIPLLLTATPREHAAFHSKSIRCTLPLDVLDRPGIEAQAKKVLASVMEGVEWRAKLERAVDFWRHSLTTAIAQNRLPGEREIEIFVVRFGEVFLVGANAELFSRFADWLRRDTGLRVYAVGYANGDWGYLATRAAYAEGGYEVDTAHIYYGGLRFKAGGLETLTEKTVDLLLRGFPTA